MLRGVLFAALLLTVQAPAAGQERGALRITVTLVDAERVVTPVRRHALLIGDNPPSAVPRRVLTGPDGTVTVTLRPGNYTVESDRPIAFQGKAYEWRKTMDIAAGGEVALVLNQDNALAADPADAVTDAPTPAPTAGASDPTFLLTRWQDSIVTLWTPSTRASGFVVDPRGLVVTSQRAIGDASVVAVQLTPAVKVGARVVVTDPVRDVAVLWIDREVVAGVRPVPLGCELATRPTVANGQEIFTIGAPVLGPKDLTEGTVTGVAPQSIAAEFEFDSGAPGGPVFADGAVVGVSSIAADDNGQRDETPVTRVDAVCDAVASATTKLSSVAAPDRTRLPVEPVRPFPIDALREAAGRRAGNTNPYQLSASDFDVAVITPVLTYAAQNPAAPTPAPARGRGQGQAPRALPAAREPVRSLTDFGTWSDYVAAFPPVLLIRVTPKLVEGFWTKVGRMAVSTQGVVLPPIKRVTSGFLRMRAFCGDAEVMPIHPFTLAQRISATDAVGEGLYVFDPSALGPACGTVKLELYSQKAPTKADTRVVDPAVLEQIEQDFAPYRAETP